MPECDQGNALVFDGFDPNTATAWFRGNELNCAACPLQGLCETQFGYSFTDTPFFHDPVPQGSELQKQMLTFRKQVQLAFAQESNQLTSVMKQRKVPVRTTKRVEKWFCLRIMCPSSKSLSFHTCATKKEAVFRNTGYVCPKSSVGMAQGVVWTVRWIEQSVHFHYWMWNEYTAPLALMKQILFEQPLLGTTAPFAGFYSISLSRMAYLKIIPAHEWTPLTAVRA